MARLDDPDGVGDQASCEAETDLLFNLRVLRNSLIKAISALTTGNHQSYELDTGQSRQRVTRLDLSSMNKQLDDYNGRISTLELRLGLSCGGSGAVIIRPGW